MIAKSAPSWIPAVGYLRMSDDHQETSIPTQKTEIEKHAGKNGIRIIRWYADEGVSGWKAQERKGFQTMIDDATRLADFELVVCYDQDRFSRFEPLAFNHYCYLLQEAGVSIETVRQGRLDFKSLAGWLQTNIQNHGSAEYSKKLSHRVCLGKHRQALAGKWVGAIPYGYSALRPHEGGRPLRNHPDYGKLVVNDDAAAVVRWLYEQYAETDTSLYVLADELNRQGTPSPGGGKWLISSIQCVLRREAYTGTAHQFTERKGDFHTVDAGGDVIETATAGKGKRDRSEWMDFQCPVIVNPDLWNQVQRKMTARGAGKSTSGRGNRSGLLAGLLYCADCGERMYRQGCTKKAYAHLGPAYVCSSYIENGLRACRRNGIREKPLLDYIVPLIRDIVLAPANLERLRDEVGRQVESKREHEPRNVQRTRKRLAALDDDVKAAVKSLARCPDDLYEMACDDLRELRQQRDEVARHVAAMEAISEGREDTTAAEVEKALGHLETLRGRFDAADPKIVREALHRIIDRVDLWFEPIAGGKHSRSRFSKGMIKFKVPDSYSPFKGNVRVSTLWNAHKLFTLADLGPEGERLYSTPAQNAARDWLTAWLADGRKGASESIAAAKAAGVGLTSLWRVRKQLGVSVAGGVWTWPTRGQTGAA